MKNGLRFVFKIMVHNQWGLYRARNKDVNKIEI